MRYQEKRINLKEPLAFWRNFEDEEKMLFYHPFKKELIIGTIPLKKFYGEESFRGYPYVFSRKTFFPTLKGPQWDGFEDETTAFEFYLVEKEGEQKLYYRDQEIEIQDQECIPRRHDYKLTAKDYGEWQGLFNQAKEEIRSKKVDKVVISRQVEIQCRTAVAIESVLKNLMENNPGSFVFAWYKQGKTFLGASPEVLVEKNKGTISSYALAGTGARNQQEADDIQQAALLNDPKNRHEHQLVVDYIAEIMESHSDEVVIGETTTLALKNLFHLKTPIHGKVKENSSLRDWVSRLHPTPALGGYPAEKALEIIARYETHERGLYGAPLGVMNEEGDGIFVVGIRSALIEGNKLYAYTGCGIVADSECEAEYLETANKARTILESL
ncbi:isochorismate synthase MenF [Desulfitobacterium sp. PCE1]|uniref:isochorismate synthase n=1 Tax=Desulfitobacterium sp. PCE1 TaxID=146907 RepID=UPI00036DD455|nr:isochorismate synthase [Desulfitobacterium sp. PCE1]